MGDDARGRAGKYHPEALYTRHIDFADHNQQVRGRETCMEEWREHVARLVADGEVTNDQSRVLDVIVCARRPILLSRLLDEVTGVGGHVSVSPCRGSFRFTMLRFWLLTCNTTELGREEALASLHTLRAKLFVGVKRLDDEENGEVQGEVLLFPGSRVVEWVQRKERALCPQQRALLVIQRRVRFVLSKRAVSHHNRICMIDPVVPARAR